MRFGTKPPSISSHIYLYLNRRHRRRRRVGQVGEERVEVVERRLAELLEDVVGVGRLGALVLQREAAHDVGQLGLGQLAQRGRHVLQLGGCLPARRRYRVLELREHAG